MRLLLALLALLLPAALAAATPADLDGLLAADRAFAEAARTKKLPEALSAMFADDVAIISGGAPAHIRGRTAAAAKFAERNAEATAEWAPAGGGISSDGSHGYTYGGMTVRAPGKPDALLKYLSYWIKGPDGWRVAAYVRRGHPEPKPPVAASPVIGRAKHRDDSAATLKAAEQAFSDRAQQVGLRAAFAEYGRPDSINIGAAPGIAVGAQAISEGAAGPEPTSPLKWSADEVKVAPGGDMGLTIGLLRFNGTPPPNAPEAIPFFTVWARPQAGDPWRYVAE